MWKTESEQPSINPAEIVERVTSWASACALISSAPETLIGGWWAEAYLQWVIGGNPPYNVGHEEMKENAPQITEQMVGLEYDSYFDAE